MNPISKLIVLLITGAAGSALGQGTIVWGNVLGTTLRAPVYGVIPGHEACRLTGNTPAGIPAGTQDYAGAPLLSGTGFTMAIFTGGNEAEAWSSMTHLDSAPFRTGTAAGFVFQRTAIDLIRPPGTTGVHVQFRAWDNVGGTVTTWAEVLARGGTVQGGMSDVFTVGPLGGIAPDGTVFLPPQTTGFRSFNFSLPGGEGCPVPEPSTWGIIAIAGGLLLACRRR